MHPHMQTETHAELSTYADIEARETDLLTSWGFTPREIASLLWLRQWYQTSGSDRATMLRHLEFLRLLVETRRAGIVVRLLPARSRGRC